MKMPPIGNPSQKPLTNVLQINHLRVADLVFGKYLFSEHLAAEKIAVNSTLSFREQPGRRSLKLHGFRSFRSSGATGDYVELVLF
jgi:hypothetical protein